MEGSSVKDHYDAIAADYHQQYERDNLLTLNPYPANYFRLQILIQRLSEARAKSVFEVGVGEGTPLATMAQLGLRVGGNDISKAMVQKARENFAKHSLSQAAITWGDIQDATTLAPHLKDGPFDAVIALGVLPHVGNDALAIQNMSMMIGAGGRLFVEFRNKLFSLFTFNRHTKEFILDDLLAGVSDAVRAEVAREIDQCLRLDHPPLRTKAPGSDKVPGYDAILSKFHNPFELSETIKACGFTDLRLHWYHYHPAPPMLEEKLGPSFRKGQIALEHEGSWRGYFLCSAGVIEATKST